MAESDIIIPELILEGLEDASLLGKYIASQLRSGDTLLLDGDLGAGKTTLTQYIADQLGVPDDQYVSSPSFALLHEYTGSIPVYHMDFYRLNDADDIEEAGLLDYISQDGVSIIEWPDRLGYLCPSDRLEIIFKVHSSAIRGITLCPFGTDWCKRAAAIASGYTEEQNNRHL